MLNNMKRVLLVIILAPISLSAQIVDINQYRDRVVEYSYVIKKSSANIAYLTELYGAERADLYPSLTLSGEFVRDIKRVEGQKSWDFGVQPEISQTIFNGGGIRAEAERASMAVKVGQLDAVSSELDVRYTADYNYYNLLAMRAYKDAVDRYVDIINALKSVVELRYQEGYIGKSDLLMIETRLSEALYQQISIEEDYTIALQKFNVLQGAVADMPVEQAPINVDTIELPPRASLEELLSRRPDFGAALYAEQQAQSGVVITRAAYNPMLSVGVAGLWRPEIPNVSGSTVMDGAIFVRLSAPLFNWGKRRRAVGAAYALCASSELNAKALIDDIRLEESNMWATIIDSKAQLIAAREALEKGSENLEISTYSYSEGLTTILDVMQAQISWLQLYSNSIFSEFSYLVSLSAYKKIAAD